MVRDGLHAKVFVSSAGAIICSANASANGVGRTRGEAGNLVEAGIFCPAGSPGHDGAAAFFDTQFGAGHQVSRTDLERAADWSNEPALPASATALESLTLIERLQQHPGSFKRMSVAIADDDVDEDIVNARIDAYNKEHGEADPITDADVFLQCDPGAAGSVERSVLLIYKRPGARKGTVWGYVHAHPYPNRRPDIVIGKANWRSFRNKVGHPDLSKKLSEDEWSSIGRLLENDDWLFTPQQFADALQSDLGAG